MKPMITNGGPHPADKWAEISTDELLDLIQIDEGSSSEEAVAARRAKRELRTKLFDLFEQAHAGVQTKERGALAKEGLKRCAARLDPGAHIPEVIAQVQAAMADTPFAAHFARPEVIAVITQTIAQRFATSMHIEREWHSRRAQQEG